MSQANCQQYNQVHGEHKGQESGVTVHNGQESGVSFRKKNEKHILWKKKRITLLRLFIRCCLHILSSCSRGRVQDVLNVCSKLVTTGI